MKFNPLWNPTKLTCQIVIGNFPASKGIQKITGFTRGLAFHRVDYFPYFHISNSIVLGYNRSENEDTVRLWFYGYINGEHFQELLCEKNVGHKLAVDMQWNRWCCLAALYDGVGSYRCFKNTGFKTLPIGYQLFPYAEIDGTETKMKFEVEIKDLKIK